MLSCFAADVSEAVGSGDRLFYIIFMEISTLFLLIFKQDGSNIVGNNLYLGVTRMANDRSNEPGRTRSLNR